MNKELYCECCGQKMNKVFRHVQRKEHVYIYKCPGCRLYYAPALNINKDFTSCLNEDARKNALVDMRNKEFIDMADLVSENVPAYSNGLEVGCAYGWFLKIMKDRYSNIDMEGIEAEPAIAEHAIKDGLNVRIGFFPEENGKEYDFIVFNNVWEHINGTVRLIDECSKSLNKNGLLFITVPLSSGILYKISAILEKIGIITYIVRLWQLHFHSPHIYFYTKSNFQTMFNEKGFNLKKCIPLRSIDPRKMEERFGMDENIKHVKLKAALFNIAWTVLKYMPADKAVFVFQKAE